MSMDQQIVAESYDRIVASNERHKLLIHARIHGTLTNSMPRNAREYIS